MDIKEKKVLLQTAIDQTSAEVALMTESITREQQAMKEAPSSRKTWSDTTRSQIEGILGEQSKALSVLKGALSAMQTLKINVAQMKTAQLGAIIETKDQNDKKETYLIVSSSSGEKITFEGKEVISISFSSPLAQAMHGHKKNDCIKIQVPNGTRTLTILNVS